MKRLFLALLAIAGCMAGFAQGPALPFRNPELPTDQRIDDLLKRMTAEEKVSQLLYNSPAIERLGIPEYNWWNESLHGVARAGRATVFPQAIGLAATFDDDLVCRIGDAISTEARAKYNEAVRKGNRSQYMGLTFWSPNINIFRDPRWGRGQETYGEDPYLTGRMGSALVRGIQGEDPACLKAAACAKHFAVHSGPEKTRHEFNAVPSEKDFRETYLPAFKTLVDNHVEAVMCAYNRLYDQPCCGSNLLLKKILREEWGFEGQVVTDCWALDDIWLRHKVVATREEAAAMAAEAGSNVNCGYIYSYLDDAISKGLLPEATLDTLLRPLLNTRFRLGLLDPPGTVPFDTISPVWVNCEQHQALAYEAALKSIVLLQNKNNVLPLDRNKVKKLFIAGPVAADIQALAGNYNGWSGNMVTFLEGIVEAVDAGTTVDYSMGCMLNTPGKYTGFWEAGMSDAVIVCLGNTRMLEGEEGDAMLNTEGGDRYDLRLPESQREYIQLLREKAPGKPIIAVVTGGGAIALQEVLDNADAVLFAWYPGEQGGTALADLLFGKANPSGRLPVTFYRSTDDLPPFDDYSMENRTYKFFTGEPLFPFGFGLSYTRFNLTSSSIREIPSAEGGKYALDLTVVNTGNRAGEEVVMVYARNTGAAMDKEGSYWPGKEVSLVGFKRIMLQPGEAGEVSMTVDLKDLHQWDAESQTYKVRKGNYILDMEPGQGSGFRAYVEVR